MNKILIVIVLAALAFTACEPVRPAMNREVKLASGNKMLVGKISQDMLKQEPYSSWFDPNYEGATVDSVLVKSFRKALRTYRIEVFFGSWCGDSKREVPHFLKILDYANFHPSRVELFGVNRNKESFYGEELNKDIRRVPTFIFYKNGKEVGRIVESPINSLEQDIADIINGTPQTPNYAE